MSASQVDGEYNYEGGDTNTMLSKQCTEVNNNDIDSLSKDFSEMGCVESSAKKANVKVDSYVYDDDDDDEVYAKGDQETKSDKDYSSEFEEESEGEVDIDPEMDYKSDRKMPTMIPLKTSKSLSSSRLGRVNSVMSARSTSYGSIPVPQTRRENMSFSNDRLRDIERQNHILLKKIVSARNKRQSSIPPPMPPTNYRVGPASAATQRKQAQRKIDHDNLILLKKIQRAKSYSLSRR